MDYKINNKMENTKFTYHEDEHLQTIKKHIEGTYGQHYVNAEGGRQIQVQDILISTGHAESFYVGNAIKYLARYGKKNGKSELDLMKAVHYVTLLMDLNHRKNKELCVKGPL
jgi:Protein of unknwon function (DUF3310)